ncbi:FAD-dependent monooxygenase [Chitinophaga qingshengii]|uniref:FAD-dependent monooxygenase n=1 Tax=Chitinophaga qingshengii TaxID=1569794 RepID=A0ABR7TLM5_9BACT|nr:FAD-dependent monooxygenase [Chitinophaga qingshengii]MBC9930873.1 FAD-dependent monooxygenase [Chitinophaga qingshengii]
MKTTTVLISGASIAGPALAFWLHKFGFDVTIVEHAPAIRPGGYAVDFRGAVIPVIEQMGLMDELRRFETRAGKIRMVDANNRTIARFPDGFTSGELEILRGDLAKVLFEATQHKINYIFNDSITALSQDETGINVTFRNGRPARYDLVFGADGIHSKVRAVAFGEENKFLSHLGLYISVFTIPNFMQLGMDGLYYGSLGKRVGIFGANEGKEARASFYFTSDLLRYDYRDEEQQKMIIRKRFERERWQVPQLLEFMDTAPDFYFDSISQIKMDRWSNGRVALVGDAAHCASPMAGMGTSMAFLGAYVLAGELHEANGNYAIAFENYERIMRPFVKRCQGLATGVDWFVPGTRFKQWMSQQFWKVLPYTPWKNMMIEMPLKIANSISPKVYA